VRHSAILHKQEEVWIFINDMSSLKFEISEAGAFLGLIWGYIEK
jgi:hypothetical protein